MSRVIAGELLKKDLLAKYVSTNISEVENEYNRKQSAHFGDLYEVQKVNFDSIQGEDLYDVICCCDSFLHSTDRPKLIMSLSKLLKPNGIIYFSDILQNPQADQESLDLIKARFADSVLGTGQEYETLLESNKLQKIFASYETNQLQRHYGLQRFMATTEKKQELLDNISEEFYTKTLKGLDQWIKLLAKDSIQYGKYAYKK